MGTVIGDPVESKLPPSTVNGASCGLINFVILMAIVQGAQFVKIHQLWGESRPFVSQLSVLRGDIVVNVTVVVNDKTCVKH